MTQGDRPFGKLTSHSPSQTTFNAEYAQRQAEGTKLNAAFIATAAALFVAVGSGTFFFLTGGIPLPSLSLGSNQEEVAAYESKMDQTCGKGWRKDLPNVDQMHCYLTKSPRRLCDPEERKHLIATIDRFEEDYGVWSARHFAAAMGTIANANANAVEIGMETARLTHKMNDPNATDEERQAQADKVEDIMGDVLEGSNKVLAEAKNTIPHYQLSIDLTELASLGLVAEDDFEWSKPDWVKKGFAAVKSVKAACAK